MCRPFVMQYKSNLTDSVMLKGCYSNFSSVDRPFRAYNNIIAVRTLFPHHNLTNLQLVIGSIYYHEIDLKSTIGISAKSGNAEWVLATQHCWHVEFQMMRISLSC